MEELGFSSADQGCRCIVGVLELERKVMTIGENTKYDLGGVSFGSCGLGGPRHWKKVPRKLCRCSEVSGCGTGDLV